MLILDSPSTDPYFNIAAEEYLLKETDGDYAFFYINDPSIIIGKHQNAWAEINLQWTRKNNIPVVRRISGGGTVWHDQGNLNFSFILNGEEGKLVNFREYASPVLDYLRGMGLQAEFGERNEMLVEGLKVSGNAEHIFRKRVLHHGTLLYSAELSKLKEALDTNPDEYEDKAVQSVRSKTGNISDFIPEPQPISEFRHRLLDHILNHFKGSNYYELADVETGRIRELIKEKYSTWKWNIGYSPRYSLSREIDLYGKPITADLYIEKGQIKKCIISGDLPRLSELAIRLIGADHEPEALMKLIKAKNLVKREWIDKFVEGLF